MPDPGSSAPKLSFGLKSTTAPSTAVSKLAARPSAAAFNDDSEDEGENNGKPQDNSASLNDRHKSKAANIHLHGIIPAKLATPATRIEKKKQQEAEQLDASIFDYDGVYDSIKDAERKVKQAKLTEDSAKKPKYVDGILESAEQRKRDRLRAEARTIQKQRLAEGDEFADKESFVTNAYKEQQAELAKAEEQQDKEEQQQKTSSRGMGSFYRDMLNETNAARDAAIAASLAGHASTSAAASPAHLDAKERSDADLAQEAREKGLEVELNDDNQIVDKRSLLSKGLNVVSKRRRPTQDANDTASERAMRESKRERDQKRQEEYEARMSRDAQRSRQSAQIEEQMLQLERKRALEEQEAHQRERSKIDAKRNDSEAISQAKQRYLERKKQRLAASNGSA
ncbi:hypothetical protein EX895_005352 [Sporisorium graminicola]|uniref:Nuclear speckle splicing regulatory protein 1 N-terminal domain-containing protein n=1 Tax=Sporisorium graminicola TaxID=280036 RepID=A0A4U7KNB1_9BASI|nr:hypothetical protein EX895_005352 [Sporisorium graminicola]TKY85811.1 hypothetical protein EX895_005352 [Sporisorium graminicola]